MDLTCQKKATFELFISSFSICMTLPLRNFWLKIAGENYKFKNFSCLKTKFEANKTTQGNAFITDLSKIFLALKIWVCVGGREGWAGLVMQKNGLIRKLLLILKFMTSQTGQQIITIHMLLDISRNEDNQAMKFGQLIKYSVTNISLQKSWRNWERETSSRPFFVF